MIDLEDLRQNSLAFIERAENDFYRLPSDEREEDIQRFNKDTLKYDADNKWALYLYPNTNDLMATFLREMDIHKDDVLLDIGAGDGRLSLMAIQHFGVKKAYALELNKKWHTETVKYFISNGGIPEGLIYLNTAYQEFTFPVDVTKIIFMAWHNGEKTKNNIIEKLKGTQCSMFGHNFGANKSIQIIEV